MRKMILLLTLLASLNFQLNDVFAQKLKPGDIHPEATAIDADDHEPFNKGLAIIKKGNKFSLINHKGEIVAPFGTYPFIRVHYPEKNKSAFSGVFIIGANDYLLASQNKIIKPQAVLSNITPDFEYLYGRVNNVDQIVYNIATGIAVKIPVGAQISLFNNGLMPFNTIDKSNSFGYMDIHGKIVVKQQFKKANAFSNDGLACVLTTNNYGEDKFGFINKKGEMIISAQYSTEPSSFYNGTAIVHSLNNPEFSMALINTKGEIIKKYKQELISLDYNNGFNCINGVRIFKNNVMLENGDIVTKLEYLAKFGIVPKYANERLSFLKSDNEGKIFYSREFLENKKPNKIVGFYDIVTKKVIEGKFSDVLYFDPTTKLAKAIYNLPTLGKYIKGYVNEDGIFMIVQKEPSIW